MKVIFTIICFVSFSISENYWVLGYGTTSCGNWIEKRKTNFQWVDYLSWAQGWISACGNYGGNKLKKIDHNGISIFLDKYCLENPLSEFKDAVEELTKQLIVN